MDLEMSRRAQCLGFLTLGFWSERARYCSRNIPENSISKKFERKTLLTTFLFEYLSISWRDFSTFSQSVRKLEKEPLDKSISAENRTKR